MAWKIRIRSLKTLVVMAIFRTKIMRHAAPVTETEAGHFLQEEVPEIIAEAVMRVIDIVQKN